MRTLTSAQIAAKNALQGNEAFAWLFDLHRDSSNVSRYADERGDVSFGGYTYTSKRIIIEPPGSDLQGTLHDFRITIGNADRTEIAYWRLGKYRGQLCVAYLVNLAHLSEGAYHTYKGLIRSASAKEKAITMTIGTDDLRDAVVPGRCMHSLICGWRWGSDECGYAGSVTTPCNLRWETCRDVYDNASRFGGAPGMPRFRP